MKSYSRLPRTQLYNHGKLFDFAPLVCTYCVWFGLFTFREDITVAEMIVGNDFQFCHHFPREGLAITTVPVSLNHCYTRQARLEYGDTVMPILGYLLQLLIFTHASRPPPQTAGLLSSSYIRNLWLSHSSRIGAFFSWESLLASWLC